MHKQEHVPYACWNCIHIIDISWHHCTTALARFFLCVWCQFNMLNWSVLGDATEHVLQEQWSVSELPELANNNDNNQHNNNNKYDDKSNNGRGSSNRNKSTTVNSNRETTIKASTSNFCSTLVPIDVRVQRLLHPVPFFQSRSHYSRHTYCLSHLIVVIPLPSVVLKYLYVNMML